ncbi:MAG: diaminopimelate epimerase [Cellulosilyticaceae bacterium]
MKLQFTKMQGCGNDYIYFNCYNQEIPNPEALSRSLADRHFGVGGDGIILIGPAEEEDATMRIFNMDGSEAKMCGNGIRCVGQYLYEHKLVQKDYMRINTLSGVKELRICPKQENKNQVQVNMGKPILEPSNIPVALDGESVIDREVKIEDKSYQMTCVSMGNPHCVLFESNVETLDLEQIGPLFEKNPLFPEQVNTEFVQIISSNELKMRVWERGSGETLACGTGACASVVAAVLNGFCKKNEEVTLYLQGGVLKIMYTDETVYMTGEAETLFEGVVEV